MRDPGRIPEILAQLEKLWQENPDFRLPQLIMAIAKSGEKAPKLFYMEDRDFIKAMQAFENERSASS